MCIFLNIPFYSVLVTPYNIFYSDLSTMAQLSITTLRDIGIDQVNPPVELPLYSRFRTEFTRQGGVVRCRSVPQDLSKQELTAVLLQLNDFRHFRR